MKILVITNYFIPEIGAASTRIYEMVKALNSKVDSIDVVCPFPNYPTGKIQGDYNGLYRMEFLHNIKVHRFYIYPDNSENIVKRFISMFSFAISLWFIIFKINTKNIDKVIIQNSPLLVSFSSILLFKTFLNKEIILNISDLWPQSAIDLGFMKENSFTHKIFSKIEKYNYTKSDKLMAQSNYILSYLNNVSNNPKILYRNIPNISEINLSIKNFNVNYDIKIIYAGLLGTAQNIFNLIHVLENMKLKFIFDIFGDGTEKNKILDHLKKRKLTNIRYFGSLSKNDLLNKYNEYDFAFVPLSTDIKGAFPSKIFELIAYSIPVIYIGYGEAFDYVNENKIGIAIQSNQLSLLEEKLCSITQKDYSLFVSNCILVYNREINFNLQINNLYNFLINE